MAADSVAIYVSGQLLFLHGTTLVAQPFDEKRLWVSGDAVPVVEGIRYFIPSWGASFQAALRPDSIFDVCSGRVSNGGVTARNFLHVA